MACSGGASAPPPQPPSITLQPTAQSVEVGATVAFSVQAQGTSPLIYQWLWNGTVIPGATNPSYSTPSAEPADNGSVFSLIVTNSLGSVTSQGALLAIPGAPRAPKAGDLRFKDVDAFPFGLDCEDSTALLVVDELDYHQASGTPLTVGGLGPDPGGNPGSTIWWYGAFLLPPNIPARTYCVSGGQLPDLEADLKALDLPGTVVTSLDLAFNNNVYAKSWETTSAPGTFTAYRQSVDPGNLQAVANQIGALGQVITALSFEASGQVYVIAYAWDQDPGTHYEVQVATATFDTVEAAAQGLSQQGFIITAIGGQTTTNNLLLVGTRVKGDTIPRPIAIYPLGTSTNTLGRAYAVIGNVYVPLSLSPLANIWIGQQ
jgi:hypothetical protein